MFLLAIDPCNGLLCTNGECVLDENNLPKCQCDIGYQLPPDSRDLCIGKFISEITQPIILKAGKCK